MRRIVYTLVTLFVLCLLGATAFFGYHYFSDKQTEKKEESAAIVTASIKDDLAAHTIMIPAEDGTQIYIRELHTSYIATGGFATIEVADHTWYDDEPYVGETQLITLTPFIKTSSGQQKPMDVIQFYIDIPLSPVTLVSPDSVRTDVATTMYTMQFKVRPGSTVTING